jgi:anti-sigma factor RsiW
MSSARSLGDYELVALLDNETTVDKRREIELILAHDPAHEARLDLWRHNDEMLRVAFARIAAEPLPAALLLTQGGVRPEAATRANDDEPIRAPIRQVRRIERLRREQSGRLLALTAVAFAAGAVFTLCAAGLTESAPGFLAKPADYLFPAIVADEAGTRLTRRAIEAFLTFGKDAAHPVEATAPAEIATWLSRRVAAPVQPPDLRRLGLRLLGGRLTPGDGAPAGLILYEASNQSRIGLYVGRSASQTRDFQYGEDHMVGAVWWMDRGASYAVVGPADRAWLTKIARETQRQQLARSR